MAKFQGRNHIVCGFSTKQFPHVQVQQLLFGMTVSFSLSTCLVDDLLKLIKHNFYPTFGFVYKWVYKISFLYFIVIYVFIYFCVVMNSVWQRQILYFIELRSEVVLICSQSVTFWIKLIVFSRADNCQPVFISYPPYLCWKLQMGNTQSTIDYK